MSNNLAPIGLFVYNRPLHTKMTIEALLKNPGAEQSEVYVFSDAAKLESENSKVTEIRNYVSTISGFKNVKLIERPFNFGLAKSIIDGVSFLCEEYGNAIVLEDDLITSPNFLNYMNEALERYESNENVMQIAGYNFPNDIQHKTDAVFLNFISSWGWATWQSAWKHFDEDSDNFIKLKQSKKLRRSFNLDNHYPYYKMLVNQQSGKTESWAIRWYLSVFFRGGLVLYPKKTLVENIGFDGSGQNCLLSNINESSIDQQFVIKKWPINCALCEDYMDVLATLPKPKINLSMLARYVKRRLSMGGL